jgi:aspartate/methionine/tyrosine aminotransferase
MSRLFTIRITIGAVSAASLVARRIQSIALPPFDPLNVRAAELRAEGHDVISLGQALPFFPPPTSALEAARAAIGQTAANLYATDPGLPSLRAALAGRLGDAVGTTITPQDLIITAGANHAFTLALTTLASPGDEVILPAPYFTNHHMAICALGAIPVEAPLADRASFSLRWTDLEPHVNTRTRVVVLCNPSNPTGAPVGREHGAAIVRESAARGLAVISDETYMHFVFEGPHWSAASEPAWRDTVTVIGSFSKSFGMMGWRVGYILADSAICREIVKVQDAMIICAPVISQIAAEAAIRESWSHPSAFLDELCRRRQAMADGLGRIPALTWIPTAGGLFAFTRVAGCQDSVGLSRNLLEEAHVVTIPGAAFGRHGEGYLRLSYGVADADRITEALRRIGEHFSRFRSVDGR